MADVFISYARDDEAIARRVAKAFGAEGVSVWWDADLPAHRAYSEIIERNLEDARAVVVLWSSAAAKSQWVRAEADVARNAGKLVQAQVDGTLPPLPFNQIQCAGLKGWRGSTSHPGWAKLAGSVQSLLSGEERPATGRSSQRLWDRMQPYRWWIAAAFALVIAGGALLYAFGMPGETRKPVLAVLPFKSLDDRDASLVAGMWEDTRTAIGRNPQLIVLGPNSAQQLADKGEETARKAADYLLQASVRTAGDRIRVSADLVRTTDGEQLWSQDFDRKLDDVFALQSDIASEIEGRIRGRLAEKGGVTPEHIATSGEAYALYSDARAKVRKRDYGAQALEARAELERVLKMDPNFAPAWATLSVVSGSLRPSDRGWQLTNPAESYARKAIELAPNLAAGHGALAMALGLRGPVARAEVERAVALDPSDFEALNWLGGMKFEAGDKKGALEAYRRVVEMEPLFWPAVLNMYSTLRDMRDQPGIQQLMEQEKRVGADYLAVTITVQNAYDKGNLAEAANVGLAYWVTGRTEARIPIGIPLWQTLLQLGYFDEAAKLGPAPDFAAALWRLDPRGLDLLESHHIAPSTFFSLEPLTENAARLYLLSGRGRKLADMYLSLKMSPEQFRALASGDGPEHFPYSAPLVAIALRQNGHSREAGDLLLLAEAKAKEGLRDGKPLSSVLLARVYAVQGRKDDALPLLTAAVARNWLPESPMLLSDLQVDPALAGLKGDPQFEKARNTILSFIARERAAVNPRLLAQLKSA